MDCPSGNCGKTPIAVLCVIYSDRCVHCPNMINVTLPAIRDALGDEIESIEVNLATKNTLGDNGPAYRVKYTPTIFLIEKKKFSSNYQLEDDDCFSHRKDKMNVFSINKNQRTPLLDWIKSRLRHFQQLGSNPATPPISTNTKYIYYGEQGVSLI